MTILLDLQPARYPCENQNDPLQIGLREFIDFWTAVFDQPAGDALHDLFMTAQAGTSAAAVSIRCIYNRETCTTSASNTIIDW